MSSSKSLPQRATNFIDDIRQTGLVYGAKVTYTPSRIYSPIAELYLLQPDLENVDQKKLFRALEKNGQQSLIGNLALSVRRRLRLPDIGVAIGQTLLTERERISFTTREPDYAYFDIAITSSAGSITLKGRDTVFTYDRPFIQVTEDNLITPANRNARSYGYIPHRDVLYELVAPDARGNRAWKQVDTDGEHEERFLEMISHAQEAIHRTTP